MSILTNIADESAVDHLQTLSGRAISQPQLIVGDGTNTTYAIDVDIGEDTILRNVPVAVGNNRLQYATAGSAVALTRSNTGGWHVTGFSKIAPGTYTRIPVQFPDLLKFALPERPALGAAFLVQEGVEIVFNPSGPTFIGVTGISEFTVTLNGVPLVPGVDFLLDPVTGEITFTGTLPDPEDVLLIDTTSGGGTLYNVVLLEDVLLDTPTDLGQDNVSNVVVTLQNDPTQTPLVEGVDFLLDPVTGTITFITGGAVDPDDNVIVLFDSAVESDDPVDFPPPEVDEGPGTDTSIVSRQLAYDELTDYLGGYGQIHYGAIGVFRNGFLIEIN